MKISQNLYAETLLKTLGSAGTPTAAAGAGRSAQATLKAGASRRTG